MAAQRVPEREAWSEELVRSLVAAYRQHRGPLMPILHDLQARCGYIDERSADVLADGLNLSRAEVYGVITFYSDFRSEPLGSHHVQICRAEACQSVGAETLAADARSRLGIDFGETTADRHVSLDQVFCLGNCALGPSVMVDGRLHGRVTADALERLVQS